MLPRADLVRFIGIILAAFLGNSGTLAEQSSLQSLNLQPEIAVQANITVADNRSQIEKPDKTTSGGTSDDEISKKRHTRPTDSLGTFAAKILGSTEDIWGKILPEQVGKTYSPVVLVLFKERTQSSCGTVTHQASAFYCPLDKKIYIDIDYLSNILLQVKSDFIIMYVISREVGIYIEDILGILPKVHLKMERVDRDQAHALKIRIDLMSDCFSGVWAHYVNKHHNLITINDAEESISRWTRYGTDRNNDNRGRFYIHSDLPIEQRLRWFKTGFISGQLNTCDTFRLQ